MSDEKRLTLGAGQRPALGIKKTVEAGKVKQSFSHGRSKSVVVEVKKRRILKRPGEEGEGQVEDVAPVAPPVAQPDFTAITRGKPAPAAPARPAAPAHDEDLTLGERLARQEALQAALRKAEQDRQVAAEEARRRSEQEKAEQVEAERQAREAKRRADEEASRLATEQAQKQAEDAKSKKPERPAHAAPAAKEDEEDESARGARGAAAAKRKPEVHKPTRTRGDERRQAGKLTVVKALEAEDSVRVRSLAALRRAREKERRSFQSQGGTQKQVREIVVPEAITVQELSNRMAERASDLVKALFKMGMMATINQTLDQDTAELLVNDFGHIVKRVAESDIEIGLSGDEDRDSELTPRPAVVTVMGHVDHGKTSLLDALRNADVVSGEAGGITQHIGAYQVSLAGGEKITFLDTPGHAAFTEMRARGANITDIVILVVAADDGIMPQTIEAINHARAAQVPMIVAINKIDKPGANPDRVRQELLQHAVVVEKMSGDVQDVEISALKKTNLDVLMGAVLAQSELLELRANPDRPADGTVIEAKLDKGRGAVATVLVRRGTLRIGDIFVIGAEWGKVRALVDDKGRQIREAGPSMPVEVLGLSGTPAAGDEFSVVESEARAREVAAYRQTLAQRKRQTVAPATLESMFTALKTSKIEEFPLVIKADVHGSVEAIAQAVSKLSTDEIRVRVLHAAVGAITESDVILAKASNAPIIGFNVRANTKAREVAEQSGVALKYYDIIYNLVDDMKLAMAGKLGPEVVETVVGVADVRDVFQAGKAGKAAGCYVATGVIRRDLKARLMRDGVIVHVGKLSSLRRFKDDVNEVRAGLECGMTLDNFTDIKPGDQIEAFEVETRERKL